MAKKIDKNTLIIGGVVGVIIIIGVGLHLGWFHGLLHWNDKPRDTPYDFTDRDAPDTPPDILGNIFKPLNGGLTSGEEEEQSAMYSHYY